MSLNNKMFDNDVLTKYIICLQDTGLQINEIKEESGYIPVEWYIDLLNNSIRIAEMYRKDYEKSEEFKRVLGEQLEITYY